MPSRTARKVAVRRRRRFLLAFALIALITLATVAFGGGGAAGPKLSPLRARIVTIATSQLGYRSDPRDSYCNRYSAYWHVGTDYCGNSNRDEPWCADFAAWVWRKAGARFVYGFGPDDINAASVSFYRWGVAHHAWHPVHSGYVPQPGDVAVYGLDRGTAAAQHVAVVVGYTPGARGPDVINGDGDRTGFSVVENGTDQYKADLTGNGGQLSGYVSLPAAAERSPKRTKSP